MRPASVFMAPSVVSYDITLDGNDQTLPSDIEPKPRATFPATVRTVQRTFSSVTRSTERPPNM